MKRLLHGVLTLLLLPHASVAFSSPAPAGRQAQPAVLSQQPGDVRLQVETAGGNTRFRVGEAIPLKLSFTSSAAKKYSINLATYDRSGRMNYEDFLVEPEAGWSDPLKDYFSGGVFMMGGLTSFDLLSAEPKVISLDLNEWVRFDRPGEYTLRVVSRRVGLASNGSPFGGTGTELRSNELPLTILPADRAWQQTTLKKAVAALDAAPSGGERLHYRVLQYDTDSLDRLKEKLAQFPAGSEFDWGGGSPAEDSEQALKEVNEFLTGRGMKLVKPQK